MMHHCPKCYSTNVAIGFFGPLGCIDCGWNHNNDHPCEVCGQPASCASSDFGDPDTHYTCKDHPPEMVVKLIEAQRSG